VLLVSGEVSRVVGHERRDAVRAGVSAAGPDGGHGEPLRPIPQQRRANAAKEGDRRSRGLSHARRVHQKRECCANSFYLNPYSTRRRGRNLQLGEDVFDWINVNVRTENYNQYTTRQVCGPK
jgi:hypothetical protein